nr:hypothetical protein [Tanacetum cinerariifolium]
MYGADNPAKHTLVVFINTKRILTVAGGCGAWRVVVMERVMVSVVDGGKDDGGAGDWVMAMRSWYSGVGRWWHGGEEVRLWLWVRWKSRRKVRASQSNGAWHEETSNDNSLLNFDPVYANVKCVVKIAIEAAHTAVAQVVGNPPLQSFIVKMINSAYRFAGIYITSCN